MSRLTAATLSAVSALLIATGCGGPAQPDPKDPSAATSDKSAASKAKPAGGDEAQPAGDEPAEPSGMPAKCHKMDGDICLPPPRFAKLVCDREYPSVAYAMFAKGTPWTRGYITTNTGGAQKDELTRDEEVIVLTHKAAPKMEIKVSGVGDSYVVLRWNGACATMVQQEEIRFEPPPRPFTPRIIWKRLEVDIREALKKDEEIYDAYIALKKTCKGVSVGSVSDKCVTADTAMSKLLADKARAGIEIPAPQTLPKPE